MLGLGSALPWGREHDLWELLASWGWWVRLLWGLGGPGLVWVAMVLKSYRNFCPSPLSKL